MCEFKKNKKKIKCEHFYYIIAVQISGDWMVIPWFILFHNPHFVIMLAIYYIS